MRKISISSFVRIEYSPTICQKIFFIQFSARIKIREIYKSVEVCLSKVRVSEVVCEYKRKRIGFITNFINYIYFTIYRLYKNISYIIYIMLNNKFPITPISNCYTHKKSLLRSFLADFFYVMRRK